MNVNKLYCYYGSYWCSSVYLGNNDSRNVLEYNEVLQQIKRDRLYCTQLGGFCTVMKF